jgi:predicted enzyme related to lactoylglutathione lyase
MHFELIAKNTKKLKDFYGKLFGWRAEDYPGMDYAMLHADPKRGINGGVGSDATGLPAGMGMYVQVDDVERFLAQARNLGATKVLQEPYDIPNVGRFAVFTDPEGNRIGLWTVPGG